MYHFSGETFADVYTESLAYLLYEPQFSCAPRGKAIKENLFVSLEVKNPEYCLISNPIRSTPPRYLARELVLYYLGNSDAQSFSEASKFWNMIKNEDGTVNSAYGHLVFFKPHWTGIQPPLQKWSQWDWVVWSLLNDKDSRQAIIHYNTPTFQFSSNRDFVCTMYNQFFIRENKLYLQYFMRSQDVIRGITFDFPWGWTLLRQMQLALLKKYPDLEIGSYIHICGSFHLYEEHFGLVEEFLQHKTSPAKMPPINTILIGNQKLKEIYQNEYQETGDPFFSYINKNYWS